MGKRLYVGNLSFETTEDMLRSEFERDGRKVSELTLMLDRVTGRSRGFAFVEMATDAEAQAAIQATDGLQVDGRALRVKEAEERQSRPAPKGWRGGQEGRRDRR
jgi:RNA recognition motif-containing protein